MQMALEFPMFRTGDPQTSKDAAEKAREFKARHIAKIYAALDQVGAHGATKNELAHLTSLDDVAICRRGKEMEEKGLVVIGPDSREGCRVWRKK